MMNRRSRISRKHLFNRAWFLLLLSALLALAVQQSLDAGTQKPVSATTIEGTGHGATVSVGGELPGDANGDGNINALDITILELIVVGALPKTIGSDANGDGNINALDITTLELIVFGALTEDGPPVTITIVIKPGGDPNSINPKSEGVIPVAILTTLDFDASIVDANSVRFGPSGAGKAHKNPHLDDVDDDGDTDMVLHFRTQDTGIAEGDTEACLTGMTSDGTEIEGCDFVMVAGK